MIELGVDIRRLSDRDERMALATVVATRRSSPRPVGAKLLVAEGGELAGSVSGGCVEADVARVAAQVIHTGRPELLTYGISDEAAFEVGLPCGGEIDVFIEPLRLDLARAELAMGTAPRRLLALTVLEGRQIGCKALVQIDDDGHHRIDGDELDGLARLVARARDLKRPTVLEHDGVRVLADIRRPPVRLVIVGAYDIAEELCAIGARLGWSSVVVDARERFGTTDRVPSAGRIEIGWPQDGLERAGLDASTAVVVLTHDDKFDVPALAAALASDAFYVGALGSRRNQERRAPRLAEHGVGDDDIARIAGPAGLDIGGESPAETAISIIAQIVGARRGRTGGPLKVGTGRIHVPR